MESFTFDLDKKADDLNITKEIYLRILAKAIEQTQQDLENLETALPLDDFEKIQSISHRLKGDYDNMRITELSAIARKMNEEVKTGKDKKKITAYYNEFKDFFQRIMQGVNNLDPAKDF